MNNTITLYTDGSSRGNPGPGGWGVVLIWKDYRKELSGGEAETTNNRMELTAVIEGLKAIKKRDYPVHIYSDSSYVVNAVTLGWLPKWVATGFKKKLNEDLWREYMAVAKEFKELHYHWVKGHAGHPENERCDRLAFEQASLHISQQETQRPE